MSFTSFIAQTAYQSNGSYSRLSDADAASLLTLLVGIWFIAFLINIAVYIVTSLALMKIFKKAGVPEWAAWVPFYNIWKVYEIGGQQGFWAILLIVPVAQIASLVFLYIAMYHIGKKLGKDGVFLLFGIFLPIVWYLWLGYDKSTWNDSASPTAPSLHRPTHTTTI